MPKLSAQLKAILREHGCNFYRQAKGDHELWESPITKTRFPVDEGMKSRHSANGVLKQAGIPKKF